MEPGADSEGESDGEGEESNGEGEREESDFDGIDEHQLEDYPHQPDTVIPRDNENFEASSSSHHAPTTSPISSSNHLTESMTPLTRDTYDNASIIIMTMTTSSCSVMSALTLSPTPFLPSWTMQQKLDATVEMNQRLLEENHVLARKLDAAEAHCMLALEQMDDLPKKLHSSKMRRKEGTINVGVRGLTSAAGLHAWEAEKAV